MNTREKPPIICSVCMQEHCAPCGKFATIDYKTRTGVCRGCAAREAGGRRLEAGKLLERANAHSLLGMGKLKTITDCLEQVKGLPGATAELGVYRGGSALLIAATASDAPCHLFDTFSGIPFQGEDDVHRVGDFKDVSLDAVQRLLKDHSHIRFHRGLFPATTALLENETYKFVHIDGDQYQTTRDALEYFYPRMVDGGIMLFDDFAWKNCPGVAKALHEFLADKREGLEFPHTYQATITKGKLTDKTFVDVYTSGRGIGDAVCALYACCGAAKAGYKIRFHTDKTAWLTRVSYPGVEIVASAATAAIDVNRGYGEQLKNVADRKQWYCDNLAKSLGIDSFQPIAPNTDRTLSSPRFDRQRYVVVSPFSLWKSREWPKENWRELARLLHRNGYCVVAIHSGNDAEQRLREYFGDVPGAVFFWGQQADWVMDVMLGAHAVIGNDSGMAHVSGMLGVKTIAIHTHTKWHQLWSHTNVISVHAAGYDCIGCNWNMEKGYRQECSRECAALRFTTPGQVLEKVIDERKPKPSVHRSSPVENRLVYFLHIHKTAGTSFRSWLSSQYESDQLLPAHRCHRFHEIKDFVNWERIRLVWGHLGYGVVPLLPEKPFLMTFLRDPVARVLSHYGHVSLDPNTESFDLLDKLNLPEMLEKHPEFFSNLQTRNIAQRQMSKEFYLEHDPMFLRQYEGQLQVAKNRLREEFDFIGFTEDYENSLNRLCELTGWSPTVYKYNTNARRKTRKDYPPSVIERIIELNQDDIALYEYAKELVKTAGEKRVLV